MGYHLRQLLDQKDFLFGVICRDISSTDVEVMAQEGYNVVWLDLEHGPQSTEDAIRLGRIATHLGMVPLVRVPELNRTHIQRLLDGGIQVVNLPDVRSPDEARELARLGKFPPRGERGVSTTSAGTGFSVGSDMQNTLEVANDNTYLMVMIESDEGYDSLDEILDVNGVDMVAVGHQDWAVSLGLYGPDGKQQVAAKADIVLAKASDAGKITCSSVSGPDEAVRMAEMGVRIMFTGVDITLKRNAFADAISGPLEALGQR